ncbi:inositol monophosphatase family protein [Aquibacillus sediminis]|uniref:inositol monophosphatase family protein n=1 Tax=Aquibacillus sediminis TaxID=2574734 RepID=UPI0011093963|nr:inositol monophosphatase family protein [Aquibacillus sediminis]
MDAQERQKLFDQAKEWVLQAGRHIRDVIDEPLEIDTKSNPNDLVTHMDRNTEQFFIEKIKQHYPTHNIISEEGYGDQLDTLKNSTVWIIDPIDGTMNFVHQKRNFAISVGIFEDSVGEIGIIYDVMEDVLYTAIRGEGAYKDNQELPPLDPNLSLDESICIINSFWACENPKINGKKIQELIKKVRGTRSYGSAALEFAYVAEGIADSYITMRLAPWDIAAGIVLINEVGGNITRADGTKLDLLVNNTILVANQAIHEQIQNDYIELK